MNNEVLPFFEEQGCRVETVLSDNGREFCGRPDRHPYELFLQLEEIEHRTTAVNRPQSNGFIERFHRTLLDEHLRVMGRTKRYETLEEMQADLDAYLVIYNTKRPHRGRNMNGRTPYAVFKAGIPKARPAAGGGATDRPALLTRPHRHGRAASPLRTSPTPAASRLPRVVFPRPDTLAGPRV